MGKGKSDPKSFSNGAGTGANAGVHALGGPDKYQAQVLNYFRTQSHSLSFP
jgi:hypothetical protein